MYGTNVRVMHEAFGELLRHHRIQQRLGGAGIHTVPATTSAADRQQVGELLRRYRRGVLTWCQQATVAVAPLATSHLVRAPADPFRAADLDHTSLVELSGALADTLGDSHAPLPTLEDLTTPADMPLVELWRRAAKAAALGEHDFTAGISHGRLDADQCRAVVADVAAIVRALVVLDQRYELIPGWERLAGADRLGWTALACALDASLDPPDYAVEILGWQPPVKTIRGPARSGLLGVLQAEHNLMVRLKTFPSVLNLRLVADSQRLLSAGLAPFAVPMAPELHAKWLARESAYVAVQQQLRDLGGEVGRGDLAAAEGAHAVSRLRSVTQSPGVVDPRVLHGFDLLFARVDARVVEVVEEGLRRRAYVARVPRPGLETDEDADPARRLRYRPASDTERGALLDLVRARLHPSDGSTGPLPPTDQTAAQTGQARRSRAELHAALVHQSPRYQHRLGL